MKNFLRVRDGKEAKVTTVELFFDLIYVFSITQLSHRLLDNLTPVGALETLILFFGVWLAWQYTAWATNWFDPESIQIRLMLFAIMGVGLIMAAAIPDAFGERAVLFAAAYTTIQVGRSFYILWLLGSKNVLTKNYRRITIWSLIVASFWWLGALRSPEERLVFWSIAVLVEYASPMIGYWVPGMGRSLTEEWTIEGGHHAERCQLFVIVALGEGILVTGASLAHHAHWDIPALISFIVALTGSLAMWWMYFDTSSRDGTHAIAHSPDPGRMGAHFHYIHVVIVAGIILSAVGNELMIAHPAARIDGTSATVLILGPLLYVVANGIFKKIVYQKFPRSHAAGILALIILLPVAFLTDLLMVGGLTTVVLIIIAAWEGQCARQPLHSSSHTHRN